MIHHENSICSKNKNNPSTSASSDIRCLWKQSYLISCLIFFQNACKCKNANVIGRMKVIRLTPLRKTATACQSMYMFQSGISYIYTGQALALPFTINAIRGYFGLKKDLSE